MELLNLPREAISAGGTGDLTIAGISGFPRFSDVVALNTEFSYAILVLGNKPLEVGVGKLVDANTFTRVTVHETYEGGVFDDTSPGPATVPVGATLHAPVTKQALTRLLQVDEAFTITDGASVDIDPANGAIQLWTLGDNRTPTAANFEDGQSVILMIDDGTAYAITWTIVDKWHGGAPTLSTDELTSVILWKVGGVVYGTALAGIS